MHVVSVDRHRNGQPIVEDERNTEQSEQGFERTRFFKKGSRRRGLLAQLHHGHAAADGGIDDLHERSAARETSIGDGSEPQDACVDWHSENLQTKFDVLRADRFEHIEKGDTVAAGMDRLFGGPFAGDAIDGNRKSSFFLMIIIVAAAVVTTSPWSNKCMFFPLRFALIRDATGSIAINLGLIPNP